MLRKQREEQTEGHRQQETDAEDDDWMEPAWGFSRGKSAAVLSI